MNICVYGGASNTVDKKYIEAAYELGRLMAKREMKLVFGGGTNGMMGAVARGVHDGGGEILGVAPKFFDTEGVLFRECTEFIFTDTMRQRKQIMDDNADAFIVSPGGVGTFEEFFEVLTLKKLDQSEKPIIILNTDGYYDPMLTFIEHSIHAEFTDPDLRAQYTVAATPKAALDIIELQKNSD